MKIKSCANIGKYAVLTFDSLPRKFKKLKIGDKKPTEKKEDKKVDKPEDNKDAPKEESMKDILQEHYKK